MQPTIVTSVSQKSMKSASSNTQNIKEGDGVANFKLNPNASMQETLKDFESFLQVRTDHHLGYPYNLDFDFQELSVFPAKFHINNLGDPFQESNYGIHSREFEKAILKYFANLWNIPNAEEYWGYVTSCGTEGNLEGILLGRESLPDGCIMYASVETHYSIPKAARMYRIPYEPIKTKKTGQINLKCLEDSLKNHLDAPALINLNCGTTLKGALDDIDGVLAILEKLGFTEDRFYIHIDGALSGMFLPFFSKLNAPKFDFTKPIGSISVSGHKFLGSPCPCGVIISRKKHVNKMIANNHISYINSVDTTIMGSRNGQAALYMWYALRKTLEKDGDFGVSATKCMENAKILEKLLKDADIGCFVNEFSNTVVFEKPQSFEFIKKWQLACNQNVCHVVVMQNIEKEKLEEFVSEMKQMKIKEDWKNLCIRSQIPSKFCLCGKCRPNSPGQNNMTL